MLHYLGRYTHRIAIGNERLRAFDQGRVSFAYRDRRRGNRRRLLTIDAQEFVRRFLLHVLPRGFVRVRHFGLQAMGCRSKLINRARVLLGAPASAEPSAAPQGSWQELYRRLTGRDPDRCPYCGVGTLRIVAPLQPAPPIPCGRAP